MKILICAMFLLLVSCGGYTYNYKDEVVIITSIDEFDNNIVRYYTTTYSRYKNPVVYKHISFLDSVNKFSIGDTVTFIKKR